MFVYSYMFRLGLEPFFLADIHSARTGMSVNHAAIISELGILT